MTARTYDYTLTVGSTVGFRSGNIVIGQSSETVGTIANVDSSSNTIKVRLANTMQEFYVGESLLANVALTIGTANGALNTTSLPFQANIISNTITIASTNISNVQISTYIAEKNAFIQNPIVRLYSIYYPGEWYPTNENGNPVEGGSGRSWPAGFPLRFAEIVGDLADDINYNVVFGSTSYIPFPVQSSGLEQSSDGKINEVSLTIYNQDDIISTIIENPFLLGNNISNSVIAVVNSELLHGIDPRTVDADPSDYGSEGTLGFDLLTRARANGLAYSEEVVQYYGRANCSFDALQTDAVNGIWQNGKVDTRDLLGAIVEIKTTFANFLDYWPEYSVATNITGNVVSVNNALAYRVGDNVVADFTTTEATIQKIYDNTLFLSNALHPSATVGSPIRIINAEADDENFMKDVLKIDQLESLNEQVAKFNLVSWLQYFKIVTPRRKFYKNTCQWKYKGEECQYPGAGGLPIPGTNLTSNTNFIAANNAVVSNETEDICGKSLKSCELRNNSVHFGGFPGVGRTVPIL